MLLGAGSSQKLPPTNNGPSLCLQPKWKHRGCDPSPQCSTLHRCHLENSNSSVRLTSIDFRLAFNSPVFTVAMGKAVIFSVVNHWNQLVKTIPSKALISSESSVSHRPAAQQIIQASTCHTPPGNLLIAECWMQVLTSL